MTRVAAAAEARDPYTAGRQQRVAELSVAIADELGIDQSDVDGIRMAARIIAVADVVEAMSSHRPYRPSKGLDVALAMIEKDRGRQFDPDAVRVCLGLFRAGEFTFSLQDDDQLDRD